MPPHVPIGVGFLSVARQGETTCVQRWSSRRTRSERASERVRVVEEGRREKHNNNRQALLRAVGLGMKLFGLDKAHCGCIAHIADLDGVARCFLFPTCHLFQSICGVRFPPLLTALFAALRLDERRDTLVVSVAVYFSYSTVDEMV